MRRVQVRGAWAAVIAVLICLCATAYMPKHAYAGELQAAGLEAQSGASNTTMYYAQELKSGQGVIGMFDYAPGTTNLQNCWYKFKTSNRRAAYALRIDSIDGRYVRVKTYYGDGNYCGSWAGSTYAGNTFYKTDADRNAWFYFNITCHDGGWYRSNRYDQFKITVTEIPAITSVTGIKVTKKTRNSISLKWNKQSAATKYLVSYQQVGKNSIKRKWVKGKKITLKNLKRNAKYNVVVLAYRKGAWDPVANDYQGYSSGTKYKTVKTKK